MQPFHLNCTGLNRCFTFKCQWNLPVFSPTHSCTEGSPSETAIQPTNQPTSQHRNIKIDILQHNVIQLPFLHYFAYSDFFISWPRCAPCLPMYKLWLLRGQTWKSTSHLYAQDYHKGWSFIYISTLQREKVFRTLLSSADSNSTSNKLKARLRRPSLPEEN